MQHQILQAETMHPDEVPQKEKKEAAAEQLSKALDYFTSQKYHECLMIMQELDKHYRLNPRYKAYLVFVIIMSGIISKRRSISQRPFLS